MIYCISCRKCPGIVYIGETGCGLGDRFREHRLDVIKKKVALPVPAHFVGMDHQLEDMQVAVIRAGLPEQDKRRRKEMRFIECFHSRGQHLWTFIGTKENVCIRKEFNSQRIG